MTQQLNKKRIKSTFMFPLRSWDSKLKFSFLFLKAKDSFPKIWSKKKIYIMSDQEVWFIKKEAASRNPEKSWGPSPVNRRNQRCVTAICPGPDANDMKSLANPAQWMFRMGTGPSNPTEILKWRTIRCYQRCFCSGGQPPWRTLPPECRRWSKQELVFVALWEAHIILLL